eukprot:5077607-Pyramimonas_sp.AAC.2
MRSNVAHAGSLLRTFEVPGFRESRGGRGDTDHLTRECKSQVLREFWRATIRRRQPVVLSRGLRGPRRDFEDGRGLRAIQFANVRVDPE